MRTVANLSDDDGDESWSQRAVRLPFIWYGRAFLRITAKISRRQEFAADRCAVQPGRAAHVSALSACTRTAGFDYYWEDEVVPILLRPAPAGLRGVPAVHRARGDRGGARTTTSTGCARARPTPTTRTRRCRSGSPRSRTFPPATRTSRPARSSAHRPEGVEQALLEFLIGREADELKSIRGTRSVPRSTAPARGDDREFPSSSRASPSARCRKRSRTWVAGEHDHRPRHRGP